MVKMGSGNYEKKKEICPACGKNCYLPAHSKYCPGSDIADKPTEDQEVLNVSEDLQFAESEEDLHPKMDVSVLDGMKKAFKKAGAKAKEIGDKGRLMTESEFREFVKLSDKLFDFFEIQHLKFTDEELDLIIPDMYYLLKHYAPDVLRYLRSDFIRLARLTINCMKIIKAKIIAHKIATGKATPEEAKKAMGEMINSPELAPYKDAISAFADNMDKIKAGLKEAHETGELPSQYTADAKPKLIDHSKTENKPEGVEHGTIQPKEEISAGKNGRSRQDEGRSKRIGNPKADRKAKSRSR